MKGMIQTVNGPIDPSQIGLTNAHAHLTGSVKYVRRDPYFKRDPDIGLNSIEKSLEEARAFEKAGGRTLIEMTAIDWGRNVRVIKRIAGQVKVNVVVTSGFNRGIFFPPWIHRASVEKLADLLTREITKSIDGTDVRAGVLKVGTQYNCIEPMELKTIRAAAKAHLATGVPISTHTGMGTMGLEQLELLKIEGVNPSSVIVGHMDRNPDFGYYRKIAQQGAYVMLDQIGKVKYHPESTRIDLIVQMAKEGLASKVLLGTDYGRKSDLTAYGGGPGLTYLLTKFAARLRSELEQAGLNPSLVDEFLVTNPSRAFAFH